MATNNGNKNAYEIRLEVLRMASNMADSSYFTQLEKVRQDAGEKGQYEVPEDNRIRDTLRMAKKLYAFVEGDKDTEQAS